MKNSIPLNLWFKAWAQWLSVLFVYLIAVVAGFFIVPLAIATSKKRKNDFNEIESAHKTKYIKAGSSGAWEYLASRIPFIRLWSNYEDGDLGESSGKWSATCKGKERSFWNRYKWLAFRNPFNYGKRKIPFFHCLIDDCTLSHYGDYNVTDKGGKDGWQFVIAVHKETGKKYYGYYSVKYLDDGRVRVWRLGFKIKPGHATETQDADDKDKAFTFRYQHASEVN